jgi:metal-responsive CopG/Arc/MetJ family transcriptional regulator
MKSTKGKVSISLDASVLQDIEIYSRSRKVPRSQVIETILKTWQSELKKREMTEGYKAMAQENTRIAEEFSPSIQEVWPDE